MGKKTPPIISPVKLRNAYKADLAAAWERAHQLHRDHTPYAFVLYGVEGGCARLWPVILTEQSLTQVAQRYLDKGYFDTLEESCKGLRYAVADSPFISDLEDQMPSVDALTEPVAQSLDDESGYALLANAAMAAWAELDAEGLFGQGTARESLMLLVVIQDNLRDWTSESAKNLNPPPVFDRFEADTRVEGRYISSNLIVFSPDRRSLYSGGSRKLDNAKRGDRNDSVSELVAFDVKGRRLSRRWTHEFPAFGDSVRDIVCSPDGASIVYMRAKYVTRVCHTILARFPSDSNVAVAERQVVGEPSRMAISSDGSRIAVAMQDKSCHLFDQSLNPLNVFNLDAHVFAPYFLRSGMILLASHAGVLSLDPAGDEPPQVRFRTKALRLAADENESLLAVARSTNILTAPREPEVEFGVQLLELPTFGPLREILVPGYQAFEPTLSTDGRLLAFNARQIDGPRSFIGVFETATGREIARRKSRFVHETAFTPDGLSLAVAQSKTTTGEAIEFWDFEKT
jgi:hypothetical protein